MFVFFLLCSGNFLWGWFRNMRTVYGKLRKKKNEHTTRPLTARQRWTSDMFKFLDKHMTIRRSSLGKVYSPCLFVFTIVTALFNSISAVK